MADALRHGRLPHLSQPVVLILGNLFRPVAQPARPGLHRGALPFITLTFCAPNDVLHQMTCCSCLLPAQVSIAVLIDNFRSASKAQRQREAAAAAARNVKSTNPLDPLLLHLCKVRDAARPRNCSLLSAAAKCTMPKPTDRVLSSHMQTCIHSSHS